MKFVVITGLSGAGKSQAAWALEDIGFNCVDNMPPELIPKLTEIYNRSSELIDKVAIVCDLRVGDMFGQLMGALNELYEYGYEYEILFLEASDETLIKRYKETRRMHPLSDGGRIIEGINKEREMLKEIRNKANWVIDTSDLTGAQLRKQIASVYGEDDGANCMVINVMSFGFKYGIPLDSDLVFDVRFLPNPFYIAELKNKTGLDAPVRDYVMQFEQSIEFTKKLCDMIEYLIPHYENEGKSQLVISIGCTGGHHRSVTIAEALYKYLSQKDKRVFITHRDIKKGI